MPHYEKDTDALLHEIKDAGSPAGIVRFLAENSEEFVRPLHEYLGQLLREKHLK